jgi:hypothetical protein
MLYEQFDALLNDLMKAYPDTSSIQTAKQQLLEKKDNLSETFTPLLKFKKEIRSILNSGSKPKSKQFNFLKQLELCGLSFRPYCSENKNTKKTIVKYLSNILTVLELTQSDPTNPGAFNEDIIDGMFKNLGLSGGFGSVEKLLQNDSILKLAEEVSKDIQNQDINPVELMSGLMSGKDMMQNTKIKNLVSNLSKQIETRIESGELDLKELL